MLTSNSATISPSLPIGNPLKFGIQTSSDIVGTDKVYLSVIDKKNTRKVIFSAMFSSVYKVGRD